MFKINDKNLPTIQAYIKINITIKTSPLLKLFDIYVK